jgi:F-type H+-transporting ATPase subunit delta
MPQDSHQTPTAIAYADALLQLASEANVADQIGQELSDIRQIIADNDELAQLLADPVISAEEKGKFLHRVFDGQASKLMLNFLGLVNEKGRLSLLSAIAASYQDLLDDRQGIVEVDVTVANRISDGELDDIRQRVSQAMKREAVVYQYVDPEIIGGLILRIKDQLIDGSVRAQLGAMQKAMLAAKPAI